MKEVLDLAKQLVVDDELGKLFVQIQTKLKDSGCANPSTSNAIRTLLDMPHISGRGRVDVCSSMKTRRGTKVEQPETKERNVESEEEFNLS